MMRRLAALLALATIACVSTELETPANHPASPESKSAVEPISKSVLEPDFDPFVHYEPAPKSADAGVSHAAHGDHAAHASDDGDASAPEGPPPYTCPMHPEIVRPAPGRCPKCGMKLVPKKGSE